MFANDKNPVANAPGTDKRDGADVLLDPPDGEERAEDLKVFFYTHEVVFEMLADVSLCHAEYSGSERRR